MRYSKQLPAMPFVLPTSPVFMGGIGSHSIVSAKSGCSCVYFGNARDAGSHRI